MIPIAHQAEAEAFHQLNPHVYTALKDIAFQVKGKGRQVFGIQPLWERLRWITEFETDPLDGDMYKLNDHYRAFYARLLMDQEPELQGFFRIRPGKWS